MPLATTQYVRSGDADIAYQVIGEESSRDIVLCLDWGTHLEAVADRPELSDFVRALVRFARVLFFDMRGVGMSSSVAEDVPIESWMDDLVAVMDAAGSDKATLLAHGQAAQMAVMAAATHPDRVTSLVLLNGFARFARADDYPAGMPPSVRKTYLDNVETQWGKGTLASFLAPSVWERPGVVEWWGRVERFTASPRLARARAEAMVEVDVRELLPLVDVPTLVVHSRDNEYVRAGHGRYLAEHIPGATLLERESADHWPLAEPDLVGAIEQFVTGERSDIPDTDRVLATVLFMDVVGSTERASALGDRRWKVVLDLFERNVREGLALYAGELTSTAGDGMLATFDGPARGIRCAWHIRDELASNGLEVRSGLHAGEVTKRGDDVAGIAVHIGARVAALAEPGEVLVTRTVRDLVAGSGISFEERGEHELKGVPDTWALYSATG
ncbi:MAG TPA: adenylate/guanylate cyclase domain-containing protein [Gaiellaceae bacterium]|nr:adenylate/guanylate cyclase domain-containing protein [Gaiellaceae bacterium]